MNDEITRTTFFGRIGNLFRKGHRDGEPNQDALPGLPGGISEDAHTPADGAMAQIESSEPRTTFLRPWVKRDQAIDQLQNGVAALTDLMGTIRLTLEKNSDRQDELLNYLSHLPEALSTLPQSSRMQGEALKAIQIGIEQQNLQGTKLTEVLERLNRSDDEQRLTLDAVRERVDMSGMHAEAISNSLSSVGTALQTVTENSDSSARVLESLRDNLSSRDSELEQVIRKQNTRFTTMLAVAIVMSMAALTAAVVFGYLGYETLSRVVK